MLLDFLEGFFFHYLHRWDVTPLLQPTLIYIMYVTLELISINNANLIGLDLPTNGQPNWLNSNNDFWSIAIFSFIRASTLVEL